LHTTVCDENKPPVKRDTRQAPRTAAWTAVRGVDAIRCSTRAAEAVGTDTHVAHTPHRQVDTLGRGLQMRPSYRGTARRLSYAAIPEDVCEE
jgi:hypothetical protein